MDKSNSHAMFKQTTVQIIQGVTETAEQHYFVVGALLLRRIQKLNYS